MSDPNPDTIITEPPPMDTAESQNDTDQAQETAKPKPYVSLRIWPPTQRTRDAVITRLIHTLTQPSVLSKRFGTIPSDEAEAAARAMEEEAYSAAVNAASVEDDGIEILQVYSRDISKRMLDAMKARAANQSTNAADNGVAAASTHSEDVSSVVDAEASAGEDVSSSVVDAEA